MQAEQQTRRFQRLKSETDSTPTKKQRGGKRPGGGRKPPIAKRLDAITRKLSNASQEPANKGNTNRSISRKFSGTPCPLFNALGGE
jgi:hypothetical protein